MLHKKLKLLILSLGVTLFSAGLFLLSSSVYAAPALPGLGSIGVCGSASPQFQVVLPDLPKNGQVYIKLGNNQEAASSVNLYFQSLETLKCSLIGTVTAKYGSWTATGTLNNSSGKGGFLITSGSGLGAYPYQPALSVLILPDASVCVPVQSCDVNYDGYQAAIEANILSQATSEIAVYDILSVSGIGYKKVSYFDNGLYLYGGTALKPIDRNYLAGGVQNTDIQVSLKDGQTLDIYKNINMGSDPLRFQYFKSRVYRSKDKALLFGLIGAVVVILALILYIIRLIYKHHLYVVLHGLNRLPRHKEEKKDDNHIVVR